MSVNKVILIGHVGKDPDVRHPDSGITCATFALATSERAYTTAKGVSVPERTDWHHIVTWRGLAENIEKYVKKGAHLYVEGKLRTRSYDDANGVKRYITEVYADEVQFLTPKSGQAAPPPPPPEAAAPQPGTATAAAPAASDDLPF